jgi:hypothetical protein
MRVTEYLWVGGPQPREYLMLSLCRMYGCLPSQLKREKLSDVLPHIVCMAVEDRVRRMPD